MAELQSPRGATCGPWNAMVPNLRGEPIPRWQKRPLTVANVRRGTRNIENCTTGHLHRTVMRSALRSYWNAVPLRYLPTPVSGLACSLPLLCLMRFPILHRSCSLVKVASCSIVELDAGDDIPICSGHLSKILESLGHFAIASDSMFTVGGSTTTASSVSVR